MNRIQILLLILLFAGNATGQTGFTITAKLTGFPDGTKFYLINLDSTQNVDSAYLKNGNLLFRGNISEPVIYRLFPEHISISFHLWVENRNIMVSGDKNNFSDLKVIRSPLNEIFRSVQEKHSDLDKLRYSLIEKNLDESDKIKRKEIAKKIKDIDEKVLKIRLQTIATYKPSLVTINELYFLRNDLTTDSLKLLFDKFPLSLKKTKYGDIITQYILTNDLKAGSTAPEIAGLTLRNETLKLSDYKGKVVLLDFWASWCAPCRYSNKELVEIFQKYHNIGFEIVSFSIDNDYDAWEAASVKDSIIWANISDLKGLYSKQAASYKIRAIPKSFLIDKNGMITDIFEGYSEDNKVMLEKKIIELIR